MTIDHGQINTRERALSSDWNRQVELGNRGIVESLSAAASASARESGYFDDGFIDGFSPVASLNVYPTIYQEMTRRKLGGVHFEMLPDKGLNVPP